MYCLILWSVFDIVISVYCLICLLRWYVGMCNCICDFWSLFVMVIALVWSERLRRRRLLRILTSLKGLQVLSSSSCMRFCNIDFYLSLYCWLMFQIGAAGRVSVWSSKKIILELLTSLLLLWVIVFYCRYYDNPVYVWGDSFVIDIRCCYFSYWLYCKQISKAGGEKWKMMSQAVCISFVS